MEEFPFTADNIISQRLTEILCMFIPGRLQQLHDTKKNISIGGKKSPEKYISVSNTPKLANGSKPDIFGILSGLKLNLGGFHSFTFTSISEQIFKAIYLQPKEQCMYFFESISSTS